jgi:hypothetical protein
MLGYKMLGMPMCCCADIPRQSQIFQNAQHKRRAPNAPYIIMTIFVPSGKHWTSKRMGMRWTVQNRRQTYLHTTSSPNTTSLSSLLTPCCSSANFVVVPTKHFGFFVDI